MTEKPNIWHDRDQKPYIEGENPYYDNVLNEIVDNMVKEIKDNKSAKNDIDENPDNLHLFMSEDSAPYEEGKCPFPRTKADDEFDELVIAKLHLVTKEKEAETED